MAILESFYVKHISNIATQKMFKVVLLMFTLCWGHLSLSLWLQQANYPVSYCATWYDHHNISGLHLSLPLPFCYHGSFHCCCCCLLQPKSKRVKLFSSASPLFSPWQIRRFPFGRRWGHYVAHTMLNITTSIARFIQYLLPVLPVKKNSKKS